MVTMTPIDPPEKKVMFFQEKPVVTSNKTGGNDDNVSNRLLYKKMESIIEKMQAEGTGVTVKTVKAFMTKIPSVFTGSDLVAWIEKNMDVEYSFEAIHIAQLLSSHGYLFPIDDHTLTVRNDLTYYRFQTPYFWPSNCMEPENTDYAVYLCKRTMQNKTRLELADYEAENLAKLQKIFSRKWEFIFMQAEAQSKVDKKRDKLERKVLDSQERAFWDVHRPMPGCVNTTELDIRKSNRKENKTHLTPTEQYEQVTRNLDLLKQRLQMRTTKLSEISEQHTSYFEKYHEYDYILVQPELPNPWVTDCFEFWEVDKMRDVSQRRVKRWSFGLHELLSDPIGYEQFTKFLEKEYSVENLRFWESVQEMKSLSQSEIGSAAFYIWNEYLADDAPCLVNIDSKSMVSAREGFNTRNLYNEPNRWCFDIAAAHVYQLMKTDSYSRYLRSDMYKDYFTGSKKKSFRQMPNLFGGVKRQLTG